MVDSSRRLAYLKGKESYSQEHRDEINARHEQTSILAKIDKRLGTHFGLFQVRRLADAWSYSSMGTLESGISWLVGGGLLAAIKRLYTFQINQSKRSLKMPLWQLKTKLSVMKIVTVVPLRLLECCQMGIQ